MPAPSPLYTYLQQHVGQSLAGMPSPLSAWLGGTLLAVEEHSLTIAFVVRQEMTNPGGILHGGIMAAMIDDLLGLTVNAFAPQGFFVSINLSVDFLASARVGDVVTARARLVRQGRRVVNAECTLTDAAGQLLARGISNLIATNVD